MRHSVLLFLRANRRHLAELLLASALVNAFVLALPLFSMLVYDKAVGNGIHDTLWALTLGITLLFALELALRLARVRIVEHAGARWDMQLDERLLRGVLAAPASRALPVGGLIARYRELGATRDVLTAQFLLPLADVPFVVVFTLVLGAIAGWLVLIPLGAAALLMGAGALLLGAAQRRQQAATAAANTKLGWLVDVLLARESVMAADAAHAAARARLWQQYSQQLLPVGLSATAVLTLVAGVYQIEAQALSVGGLISATMLGGRLVSSLCLFAPVLIRWREFRRALADLAAQVDLGAAPLAVDTADGPLGAALAEGVRLEGAGVGYGERGVLSGLSLQFKAGEMVALVGASGAGKTTLLRLLAGRLAPTAGRLAVGGQVIDDDAARRRLAGAVAYKAQEPGFLAGTVADVVAPGGGDDAGVLRALRTAGLGPALDRNELGLNTPVGANGAGLSGGQRQMLALARVLHQSSDLLLLDEPTLGLDRPAQETLLAALPALKAGRCVIVATHGTELIQICDRVIVLERGGVVADAPPARLLAPRAAAPRRRPPEAVPAGRNAWPPG